MLGSRYIPTVEEHKEVTVVSSGYKNTLIASFAAMGDVITDDTFKCALTMPPLTRACCVLCRLMDDIVTHKVELTHILAMLKCDLFSIATQPDKSPSNSL
ncbi:putative alpha-isocomene synthase [Helianthus anomalus]